MKLNAEEVIYLLLKSFPLQNISLIIASATAAIIAPEKRQEKKEIQMSTTELLRFAWD